MAGSVEFKALGAVLQGVRPEEDVWQFRGLRFGRIQSRFARAEPVDGVSGKEVVDCSRFGPRCPQIPIDVRHLLRIPPNDDQQREEEVEDEFECLNLDVTTPAARILGKSLFPVMVWIHGGSQIVTFASAASGVCDPTRIVRDSIQTGQPVVFVSVNYRLNLFAFGDLEGEKNLALTDQRLAIDWVRANISAFGGDPDNITLAGESAGAVYCHAHIITHAPIRRAILSSGSLYLSPPQPVSRGKGLIDQVINQLKQLGYQSLRDAPAEAVVHVQDLLKINTLWLQQEPALVGWEEETGSTESLLIGDVAFESVIWRNGIQSASPEDLARSFDIAGPCPVLRHLYGIFPDRPSSCRLGALDFLTDTRFTLPVETVTRTWRQAGKKAFRYLLDQPNPWQRSSDAHHAVDLLFLFGRFDYSFDPAAERVGMEMRKRWIMFLNARDPWVPDHSFAFGPCGDCKEIDELEFNARRRTRHLQAIEEFGLERANAIFGQLAAGRISLLN